MPFSPPNETVTEPPRSWSVGMRRGAGGRCPNCGTGSVFDGYLKIRSSCTACGHALDTFFIVGHIIVAAMVMLDRFVLLSLWAQAALWLPLTLFLTLALLRPVKGAVLGVMWANHTRS
jgi:uncharacterized protein (DUF983 family)